MKDCIFLAKLIFYDVYIVITGIKLLVIVLLILRMERKSGCQIENYLSKMVKFKALCKCCFEIMILGQSSLPVCNLYI